MKRETLEGLTSEQLDARAGIYGVDVSGCSTKAEKIDAIVGHENRIVKVKAAGQSFDVPFMALRDARVAEFVDKQDRKFSDFREVARILLGEDGERKVVQACTDGEYVDSVGYAIAVGEVIEQLNSKN